jgi:hypothetical protein
MLRNGRIQRDKYRTKRRRAGCVAEHREIFRRRIEKACRHASLVLLSIAQIYIPSASDLVGLSSSEKRSSMAVGSPHIVYQFRFFL